MAARAGHVVRAYDVVPGRAAFLAADGGRPVNTVALTGIAVEVGAPRWIGRVAVSLSRSSSVIGRAVAGHLNGRAVGTIGISRGTTIKVGEFTGEKNEALVQATWKDLVARDSRLRADAPGLADSVVAVGADSAPARSIAVTTATRLGVSGFEVRRRSPMRAPRCSRLCASRPPDV